MTAIGHAYNAGDPAQVEAKRKTAKYWQGRRDSAFTNLMSTDAGRALVYSWLEHSGVFRSSFTGEYPFTTAFNEGARNFGLSLLGSINRLCPEQYLPMCKEANHDGDLNVG